MKTFSNEIKSSTKEDYMVYGNRGCPKFNIWALSDKLFRTSIFLNTKYLYILHANVLRLD